MKFEKISPRWKSLGKSHQFLKASIFISLSLEWNDIFVALYLGVCIIHEEYGVIFKHGNLFYRKDSSFLIVYTSMQVIVGDLIQLNYLFHNLNKYAILFLWFNTIQKDTFLKNNLLQWNCCFKIFPVFCFYLKFLGAV